MQNRTTSLLKKLGLFGLAVLIAVTSFFATPQVFAERILEKEQQEVYDKGIKYYDVTEDCIPGGANSTGVSSGEILAGTEFEIPDNVKQIGPSSRDLMNFGYWYNHFAQNSLQRKFGDLWAKQGKPFDIGAATLDGKYYMVAAAQTYGTTGDILSIVLKDGSHFNAVMVEAKNTSDSTYTKWGHDKGDGISVLEFQAYDGKTICNTSSCNSIVGSNLDTFLKKKGWYNKGVAKVINAGKYFDGDEPTASNNNVNYCQGNSAPSGDFVYYNQWKDPRWANRQISPGGSTYAQAGCGVTSIAMIVATLIDKNVTPIEMGNLMPNGYNSWSSSAHLLLIKQKYPDLEYEDLGKDWSKIEAALREGKFVLASTLGLLKNPNIGHIIVLRGIDKNGKLMVEDPNAEEDKIFNIGGTTRIHDGRQVDILQTIKNARQGAYAVWKK